MSASNDRDKRRRRWLRFRLRTLLLGVLVIGLVFAPAARKRAECTRHEAVIADLIEDWGSVTYDDEFVWWQHIYDDETLFDSVGELMLADIEDATVLADMPNLTQLSLAGYESGELPKLGHLPQVEILFVFNVASLDHIAGLKNLQHLFVHDSTATDVSPLAEMENLESLHLHQVPVSDITPLTDLQSLKILRLKHTSVTDISPLANLTQLRSLSLGESPVADLSALAGLTRLEQLSLNDTSVSDLKPLAGLVGLCYLGLWRTKVSDLSPLAGLTKLESLGLLGTKVTDLSPLAKLTQLAELHLDDTNG